MARAPMPDNSDASYLLGRLSEGVERVGTQVDRVVERVERLQDEVTGKDGRNGLRGICNQLRRDFEALSVRVEGLAVPTEKPETIRAKADAVAIRVGAYLAIAAFVWSILTDIYRSMQGG